MSAVGMIRHRGVAVTFKYTALSGHTASTDRGGAPSPVSVAGYFLRTRGDMARYAALHLKPDEAITGQFTPTVDGETPRLGALFTVDSTQYVVKELETAGAVTRVVGTR